jgi:hypothetical protein
MPTVLEQHYSSQTTRNLAQHLCNGWPALRRTSEYTMARRSARLQKVYLITFIALVYMRLLITNPLAAHADAGSWRR